MVLTKLKGISCLLMWSWNPSLRVAFTILSPSISSPIGCQSSTLWVTILLSKRQCVPSLSSLQLRLNSLWAKGVSLFMSCTILYCAALIYLYLGCMLKRITLQYFELSWHFILPLKHSVIKLVKQISIM